MYDKLKGDKPEVRPVLCIQDLLLINGKTMVNSPLLERKAALGEVFKNLDDSCVKLSKFEKISIGDIDFEEKAQNLCDEATAQGCRRYVFKTTSEEESSYVYQSRKPKWVSLKRDKFSESADPGEDIPTFNVVPIGAFFGKGKNTGKITSYLVAVYDSIHDYYYPVSRLWVGISQDDYQGINKELVQIEDDNSNIKLLMQREKPDNVIANPSMTPDIWLPIQELWNIKCRYVIKVPLYNMQSENSIEIGFLLSSPYFIHRKITGVTSEEELREKVSHHHDLIEFSRI